MPPPISAVAGVDDAWVPPTMTRRRTVWPTVPPVPCPLAAMDEGAPIHGALGKVIRAMGVKEFAAKVKMAGPGSSSALRGSMGLGVGGRRRHVVHPIGASVAGSSKRQRNPA